jgi:RNA polymerase sigma factor (sigma-70 family)
MVQAQLDPLLRHLRRLIGSAQDDGTDAQLLHRFLRHRDESAFAALVQRHGRLVWGVCRRVLGHEQDAEDAFQATFLVLARQAGSIQRSEAVGSWLYRVAHRIATRAGVDTARRRARQKEVHREASDSRHCEVAWRELQAVLTEELNRLPEKYRAPFVLCCLEGKSGPAAARQLGWKVGTVAGRLGEARKRLQQRLARRGISLAAVLCAVTLGLPAAAPAALVQSTLTRAVSCVGHLAAPGLIPARVAALMEGVGNSTFPTWAKLATLALLAAGVLALGAALLTGPSPAQPPDPATAGSAARKPRQATAAASQRLPTGARPDQGLDEKHMTITGRVLTPTGKVADQARVAVLFWSHLRPQLGQPMPRPKVLAEGRVDGKGQFQFKVRRPAPFVYYRLRHYQMAVVALAAGYGVGFYCVKFDAARPEVELRLQTEQVRRGRLLDLQGQPAVGVRVEVVQLGTQAPEYHHFTQVDEDETIWIFSGGISGRMVLWEKEIRLFEAPPPLAAWPGPATTDATGRFTLRGIGPNQQVGIHFRAENGVAPQAANLPARKEDRPPEVTYSLDAARLIEGTVTDARTGAPLPRARVQVCTAGAIHPIWPIPADWRGRRGLVGLGYAPRQLPVSLSPAVSGRTDARGRFRLNPFLSHRYTILVTPAEGEAYLSVKKTLYWPRGAGRQTVAVALPRGVYLRGRVSETPRGKGVAQARIDFWSRAIPNTIMETTEPADGIFYPGPLKTDAEGEFRLVAPPGPCHLLVNGPGPDYVFKPIAGSDLGVRQPADLALPTSAGRRQGKKHYYYPDEWLSLNFKAGARPAPLKVQLRRAPVVRGRLVGPDGKPAAGAKVWLGQEPFAELAAGFLARKYEVKDGRFALAVRHPDAPLCVAFLDPERGLGAVAAFTAPQAGPDLVTVRLSPCGSASARFVDTRGKPLAGYRPLLWLSLPAQPYSSAAELETLGGRMGQFGWFNFDAVWAGNADPLHHGAGPKTDTQGRVTLPALIPGATYRIARFDGTDKVFKAESGKTGQLGDLAIKDLEATRQLPTTRK